MRRLVWSSSVSFLRPGARDNFSPRSDRPGSIEYNPGVCLKHAPGLEQGTSTMAAAHRSPLALDLTLTEWAAALAELGQPAYRARQIFRALHAEGIREWNAVQTLPTGLRAALTDR